MTCKQTDCTRRSHTRGWCPTHYRRARTGRDMGAPIRRYVRHQGDIDGTGKPGRAAPTRPKRERVFAAEYRLLAELGLRENPYADEQEGTQ